MEGLIYKDESYYILGLCYAIQNQLGPNQKESPYCDAMEILLKRAGKIFEREYEILIPFDGEYLGGNRVDFVY